MNIKTTAVWMSALLIGGAFFVSSRSAAQVMSPEMCLQPAQAVTLADDDEDEGDGKKTDEDDKKSAKEEKKRLKEEERARRKEEREAKRAERRAKREAKKNEASNTPS